jgi:hypothetical protein
MSEAFEEFLASIRLEPVLVLSRYGVHGGSSNETVEKPQNAQIFVRKVLCFQYLFFQVQTFSTVSTIHCTVLPPACGSC